MTYLSLPLSLFWIFFKTGLYCFGGGNAMISIFERILVTEEAYLTPIEFADMIAISQITPGPFGVNIATYTGAAVGTSPLSSVLCSFMSTFGITLPSVIYVLLAARFFTEFGSSGAVKGVMNGIKPGVIGLISASALLLCRMSIYDEATLLSGDILGAINVGAVFLCVCAAILTVKTKLNPVLILIGGGVMGILIF